MSATRFLTTDEVAETLRTSPETVRFWRHVGKGPASFKVGRRVLYATEEVEAFVAQAAATAVPEPPGVDVPELPQVTREAEVLVSRVLGDLEKALREKIAKEIEAEAQFEGPRAQRVIQMCAGKVRRGIR